MSDIYSPIVPIARPFPPTERMADLLRFVAGFTEKHGRAPTYSEMGDGMGLCRSRVHDLVTRCRERGLIEQAPKGSPGVAIVANVAIPRSPDGEPLFFVRMS